MPGARGYPIVESLEDLYSYNNTCFLRSGETPGTPLFLRGLSEDSSRAPVEGVVEANSKSHVLYIIITYHDFELASTASSTKALGESSKSSGVRGRFKKKISSRIKVRNFLIKFYKSNIIRKRVF